MFNLKVEGMVLAIEPYVDYWHLQDLVHITREGPQIPVSYTHLTLPTNREV